MASGRGGQASDPTPVAPPMSSSARSEREHFRFVHDQLVGKEYWVTVGAHKFYWNFETEYSAFYISANELGIPSLQNRFHVTIVNDLELSLYGGIKPGRRLRHKTLRKLVGILKQARRQQYDRHGEDVMPVTLLPYGWGNNFSIMGPLFWLLNRLRWTLCQAFQIDPNQLQPLHITWKRPPGW